MNGKDNMLGYNQDEIYKMMAAVSLAKKQLSPSLLTTPEIAAGLDITYDFLDGLLQEGHVM